MTRHRGFYIAALAIVLLVLTVSWLSTFPAAGQSPAPKSAVPKYIFIFLADGAGIPHMEITRQYNRLIHNEGLVITDKVIKEGTLGLITTHAADSLSTDSAAAATALASGCKAKIGSIGMCADGTVPKTVLEIAKEKGMRVGLLTNSTIYDASPAAFLCHVRSRRDHGAIVDRYVEFEPDLILGGGRDQFLPKSQAGSRRSDETDIIASLTKKGYLYVSNKQELEQAQRGKVLGLFSLAEMSLEIDRDSKSEPSIYDMTRTAIRLLHEKSPRGFVAFIENENIDTAGHLTDIAALIHDFREFDRAVGLAYDFYKKYPQETLILVTSDHETGGLSFTMALRDLDSSKGGNQIAGRLDDLKKIQSISISLKKATEILGPQPTLDSIDRLMKDHFSGFVLAPDIKEAMLKRRPLSRTIYADVIANALGMMVANNTQAYWQTTSHTNHPVFVAALGPGAEKFRGYQDNADFGRNLKAILETGNRTKTTSR